MPSPQGREDRDAQLQQAQALMVQGKLEAAEGLYRQLLGAGVENAGLLSNLAVICWQSGRYDEMEQLLRRALRLQPRYASAHYNLALVLAQRGAGAEAIDHYRQALPLAASELQASIHWNLSKLLLRQGDYAEGWEHYEWRRRKANPLPPICPPGMSAWDGRSPIADQLVLVGEQGLGDMLQFLRYAPAMGAFAPQVALCLPEKLHGVVLSSGLSVPLLRPAEARAQRHGVWLPLLSAPALLGVRPEAVQVEAPYLKVPAARVEHWRQRLRAGLPAGERLVAIHWQGDPATETSELRGRSLPLQRLAPLARIQGVRLVSLQKGPGSEQLPGSAIAQRLVPCQAAVDACWDFVETGAIALACDLLISSDSALVHLAGGLGVPTWLLLHHTSDWRWGEQGHTSFWYPSLRLFRQQRAGDWGEVIERVVAALAGSGAPESARSGAPTAEQQALELLRQGRLQEAEAHYRQQLSEGFSTADVPANLGAICGASGRLEEAVPLLEQALQLDPHHLSALANLAEALCQQGRWQQAEPLLRRALQRDPNHLQALNRLRSLLSRVGRRDEAISLARRMTTLAPQAPEAHYNLGVELRAAGALAEARSSYERSLALRPDQADAQANLSMILLLQGDYARGLELREARLRKTNPVVPIVQPELPRWRPGGTAPGDGPLLVVGEQGLGDMLQFLRYVPALQPLHQPVWLCLPESLVELARVSGCAATVLSPAELEQQRHQSPACWVPLLSVPWHLGVTPDRPLKQEPYLQCPALQRQHWKERIGNAALEAGGGRPVPVVAIHWQGNLETAELHGRSLPLEAFAPVARREDLALLSLQKGYGSEQLECCSFRRRFLSCQTQVDSCWSFVDTAAMLLACDLVITSDSALAHLAGGLGVPTWLLLKTIPDWRWGLEGNTSFWYPSMRLFRQQEQGNWDEVIERVVEALLEHFPGNTAVSKKSSQGTEMRPAGAPAAPSRSFNPPIANYADQLAKAQQAVALIRQDKHQEAEVLLSELIAQGMQHHVIFNNLAAIYTMYGRFAEAEELLHQALEIKPNHVFSLSNLGYVLVEKGNFESAADLCRKATTEEPEFPDAYNNLGNALKGLGKLDEAIACYCKAIHLKPNYPEAHWNSSLTMLLGGDYKTGWEKYEWRLKINKDIIKPHAQPKCSLWDGSKPDQESQVLLVSEQGLGDTLQFMRYAIALRSQGYSVSICAQSKLHSLIQASGIDASPLTPQKANEINDGQWIPLLSVPRYLEVSPCNPIVTNPYIKPTDALTSKWQAILGGDKRPIIGINWQGNPKTEKTGLRDRSLALEAFSPVITLSQISLLSLQKGFGSEQLEHCSFRGRFVSCQPLVDDTWDFLETAAIIANCDLVITSDSAMAHLAGGMGRPVWLLLKQVPDWRWGLEGDTTFWYPSMRLFRQQEQGNWDEVIERVVAALSRHFPHSQVGASPADPGLPPSAAADDPGAGSTPMA